jgi:hypothetical protein
MIRSSTSLLLLLTLGCRTDDGPSFDTDGDTDSSSAPRYRTACESKADYFGDAATWKYPGSENLFIYQNVFNFMASTRDGAITVDPSKQARIDGTMALQSRLCGGTGQAENCNIVGFDGNLFGFEVTPRESALAVHDDFWCYDESTPLWFAGLATMEAADRALFVYAEEAGIEEADGDPVANPSARIYGLDIEVWEVPTDCTMAEMPCGATKALATGLMLRSDRLKWD